MGGLWRLSNSSMGFHQPIWIRTNKTTGTLRFDRRKWWIFLDFQTIVKGGLWGVYVCMWLILFGSWHHCIVVAQAFCWGDLVDFGATFRVRPFSRMRLGLVVVVRVYVSVLCWLIWLSGLELLIQSILLMPSAMVFPLIIQLFLHRFGSRGSIHLSLYIMCPPLGCCFSKPDRMHFGTQKKQQIHTGDGSFDLGGVVFVSQWLGSIPDKKIIHPQVSEYLRIADIYLGTGLVV